MKPKTVALRANIDEETVRLRYEIKEILAKELGRPIGRVSDTLVVTRALKAYHQLLKAS